MENEKSRIEQAAFFHEWANHWEQTCYPPEVRVRLTALVPEFGVAEGELSTTMLTVGFNL